VPSRKQRRRRQKLQRHEYEYVVETEEGEVPVERLRDLDDDARPRGRDGKGAKAVDTRPVDRHGRPIQKPSLTRVLRRAAVFAPILGAVVYILEGDRLGMVGVVGNTLVLVAFFIPFSYLVDTAVYRMLTRRAERARAEKRR
jgi:hypothetical protein